jgi:pantoate--beta-alanine ligase
MRSFSADATTSPAIVRQVAGLRETVRQWRADGQSVALVPTMGAIHDGHLSLVTLAQSRCDQVIVSLFVNPKQFGTGEDIDTYPADETRDSDLLTRAGVDLLFAPAPSDIYPPGFATIVEVTGLTDGLCGAFRPGHFAGVATVVAKLLLQCAPDLAVFGEKDYQQLQVIRRLVRDLDMDVEIIGAPTIREPDGLAISSRNAYLSSAERAQAPALYKVLSQVADQVTSGSVACDTACRVATDALLAAGFRAVDYVAVCDTESLQPLATIDPATDRPARILAAAWLGEARLIDNVAVPGTAI